MPTPRPTRIPDSNPRASKARGVAAEASLRDKAVAGDKEAADMLLYLERSRAGQPIDGFDAAPSDPYFQHYNPNGHQAIGHAATNDAARATSFLPREGPHGAPVGEASQSALEMLLARLNGGGDGGGFQGVAGPDRAAYIRPYDVAEQRANEAFGRSVPALKEMYAGLQGQVAARGADVTAAKDTLQAERDAQMGQRLTEVSAPMQSQAALVDGGEVATGASTAQDQALAGLKAQFDAERGRGNRLDQVDAQAQTALEQSIDGASVNSAANARNNLDDILAQIGAGRANAESKYQADAQSTASANQRARQEYEDSQRAAAQDELNLYLQMQTGLAQSATKTGSARFDSEVRPQIASKYPVSYDVFNNVISMAKGKGAQGRASALSLLNADAAGLADGSITGKRHNVSQIRDWIDRYFDDGEQVDQDAFASLGGDPAVAGFLDKGITDPKLIALLLGGR